MQGYTLLEVLLVLGIVGLLALIGVNRYRFYEHHTTSMMLRSDVTSVLQALNGYFHQQGCSADGSFAGNELPSLDDDLGLPRLAAGRSPLVSKYIAAIADTGNLTQDGKPIYTLQVSATFNTSVSNDELAWYQTSLDAAALAGADHELTWQRLPAYDVDAKGNQFWVLNGTLSRFRQIYTQNNTGSYCAQ